MRRWKNIKNRPPITHEEITIRTRRRRTTFLLPPPRGSAPRPRARARTHTHTHTHSHSHTHKTFASVAGSACRRDREASACMCCFASVLGILSSLIWEVQGYLAHCTVRQITTVPSGRRFSRSVLSSQRALNVRAAPMPTRTSWVKF